LDEVIGNLRDKKDFDFKNSPSSLSLKLLTRSSNPFTKYLMIKNIKGPPFGVSIFRRPYVE